MKKKKQKSLNETVYPHMTLSPFNVRYEVRYSEISFNAQLHMNNIIEIDTPQKFKFYLNFFHKSK